MELLKDSSVWYYGMLLNVHQTGCGKHGLRAAQGVRRPQALYF